MRGTRVVETFQESRPHEERRTRPTDATVSIVVATRDRPELLRRALRSFLQQERGQVIEIIVVFDRSEIDPLEDVRGEMPRGVDLRLEPNTRTPGLAGARNTGILAARGELIAFCDDDDEWNPDKLGRQLDLWDATPEAIAVGTGMIIQTESSARVRHAPERVTFADFLDSRIFSIPSSGFLLRRSDLLGQVGLVDESLPSSYGEDWDLLLRLTRRGDLINVSDPVVIVHWNRPSFFTEKWQGIASGLQYLLEKYPEFATSRAGTARMSGQIAFAHAALGDRPQARAWARRAIGKNFMELRAWAALVVSVRLVSASTLVALVNRRGRGL